MLVDNRGLVLIELLVVFAIVLIIFIAAAVNLSSFQESTSVLEYENDLEEIQGLITKAHSYARAGRFNDDWGVLRLEQATSTCGSTTYVKCFILFKGSDFPSRDKSYDEFIVYHDDLLKYNDEGFEDAIYFQRITGWGQDFKNTTSTDQSFFRFRTADGDYDCKIHVGIFGVVYNDCADTAQSSFDYSKKITIHSNGVSGSEDLRDYIFLFSETHSDFRTVANGGKVAQADGGDIIFTTGDSKKQLEHDLELYDATTGQVIAWVKIPRLSASADTVISIAYGNPSINNQSTTDIWEGYFGVYHLAEDPSSGVVDSTVNNADGTAGSGLDSNDLINAKVGKGVNFETGSNQSVNLSNISSNTENYTISLWINSSQSDATSKYFLCNQNSSFCLAWMCNTSGLLGFYDASGGSGGFDCFGDTPNDGSWHHIVYRFNVNEDSGDAFVDGVQSGSAGGYTAKSLTDICIADIHTCAGGHIDGVLDEIRIYNGWRSADWIATEYSNINSTSTFYTLN